MKSALRAVLVAGERGSPAADRLCVAADLVTSRRLRLEM